MKARTGVAHLIPLLLVGLAAANPVAWQAGPPPGSYNLLLAEAETGGAQRSATQETSDETTDEAANDRPESTEDVDSSGNWLTWLVGLPLLAGLILLVLLLSRGKRAGREDEADE